LGWSKRGGVWVREGGKEGTSYLMAFGGIVSAAGTVQDIWLFGGGVDAVLTKC